MKTDNINSNVKISEDAISSIITLAINEIEGASAFEPRLAGKFSKHKPVVVDMSQESISIEASITINYGDSIQEIASKVQENIKNNVEIMTSLKISDIVIHIVGLTTV